MLRASRVTVQLSADDIAQAIASYALDRVALLGVALDEGALLVKVKVSGDPLPMAVNIDLRLTVLSLAGARVTLGVNWTNMGLIPGFLKEKALAKAFEELPGRYEQGRYMVDLSEVLEEVPVTFAIAAVRISPDYLEVELANVMAFPLVVPAVIESEQGALVPVASVAEADLPEHQDFYQKLRAKVKRFTAERAPRWVQPLLPWLLLLPDFFVLVVRLAKDPRVPTASKVVAGAAIAYMIMPLDIIPDVIPILGQVDDEAVILFALDQIASNVPGPVIEEHWPGEGHVLGLIRRGTELFGKILPSKMMDAIQRVFRKP